MPGLFRIFSAFFSRDFFRYLGGQKGHTAFPTSPACTLTPEQARGASEKGSTFEILSRSYSGMANLRIGFTNCFEKGHFLTEFRLKLITVNRCRQSGLELSLLRLSKVQLFSFSSSFFSLWAKVELRCSIILILKSTAALCVAPPSWAQIPPFGIRISFTTILTYNFYNFWERG